MRLPRVLLCLLVPLAAFCQERKYSLTGRLVLDNEQPVANAEVSLSTSGVPEAADPVLTDEQGRFAFTGLPQGSFMVSAHRNDLGSFLYWQSPQLGLVTSFNLNEKFPSQDIVFRIERFGTIVGTVRDAIGNPLPNVPVAVDRRSWANGKAAMQSSGSAMTDDLGRFRIPYVTRGRYRVCAAPQNPGEAVLPVGYATFGESARVVYAPSCAPDARSNALLEMTPGKKLEVNLVLSPRIPVEVSGTVPNLPENQTPLVVLEPMEASAYAHMLLAQASGEAHEFHFKDVLPGRYWARTQATRLDQGVETQISARVPLTVDDSGITGLQLPLDLPPTVDVVIHAPQHAGRIAVGLRDADDPFSASIDAASQSDGTLRIALQHGGRYWLVTRTSLCPASARLGEIDLMNRAVEIANGAKTSLEVTFTDRCGDLVASVVDHEGKPVLKARLLILLTGTPDDPGDLFVDRLQEDGTYAFVGFTPGNYYLWAWDESDEWNGTLDDLKALQSKQTSVEIKAGEKATVKVPLLSESKQEAN